MAKNLHVSHQAFQRLAITLRTPSSLQHKWTLADRLWMPLVSGPFLRHYKARLTTNLRKMGLQWTDTFVVYNADVEKAVSRLGHHDTTMRQRRIKRAIDLDAKKEMMPEHMRNYDPFEDLALLDLVHDQINRRAEKAAFR